MAIKVMILDDGSGPTLGRALMEMLSSDGVIVVGPREFVIEAKSFDLDVFPGIDKKERNYPSLKEGIRTPRIKKGRK